MPKEVPLQVDMFSGELVDNRTKKQKKIAQQQAQPQQIEMFSQREVAQFGVQANPKLPISLKTHIELAIEDRRSEAEIALEQQRTIEEHTYPLPWALPALEIDPSHEP
ncbi:MAG: hypothetical protein H6667_25540 [Ardenticatenaceae bacterium]|nr:hypothetical protein [Ardenticatenaceae bacterium]